MIRCRLVTVSADIFTEGSNGRGRFQKQHLSRDKRSDKMVW